MQPSLHRSFGKHRQGGKNNSSNPYTISSAKAYTLKAPSKSEWVFVGWFTDKKCTKQIKKIDIGTKKNITLYAKWKQIRYVVKLDANGGKTSKSRINVTCNGKYGKLPKPTRDEYRFVGWFTSKTGGTQVKASTIAKKQKKHKLYAHWEKAEAHFYNSLYSVDPGLFDAIASGSIDVEKYDSYYYYKFVKGDKVVYIQARAFTGYNNTSFANVNKVLSDGLSTGKRYGDEIVFLAYNTYKSSEEFIGSDKLYTTHCWDIYKMRAESSYGGQQIILQNEVQGHLVITLHTHVLVDGEMVTPRNKNEYRMAIERSGSARYAEPEFKLKVSKPGKCKIVLSNYEIAGKGNTYKTANIDELVNIAYTLAKMTVDFPSSLNFANLYKLYGIGASLNKKNNSEEYLSRKSIMLSKGKKSCVEASFTSPIGLYAKKDYYKVVINLSDIPNSTTKYEVEFSIPSYRF